MHCADAKKLLKEKFNKDVLCCFSCHSEADEGHNPFLDAGTEPCCTLITELTDAGIDPWIELNAPVWE